MSFTSFSSTATIISPAFKPPISAGLPDLTPSNQSHALYRYKMELLPSLTLLVCSTYSWIFFLDSFTSVYSNLSSFR